MKISLAPISYYWPRQTVFDFYAEIAKSTVDIVYLGETICYKRKELRLEDWLELGDFLAASGKEVILSTQALIEANAELNHLRKICRNSQFVVEANDIAAVQLLTEIAVPFVAGPTINIYNHHTLACLTELGLKRWVMPVELGRETLEDIHNHSKTLKHTAETEVFAYGKLPLAYSARCFTARAKNLQKDNCQLSCLNYPEGLLVNSQEDQRLFTINGIQTQSAQVYDLRPHWQDMRLIGVDIMRISPQEFDTAQIIDSLYNAIHNQDTFLSLITDNCDGYWFGRAGLEQCSSLKQLE